MNTLKLQKTIHELSKKHVSDLKNCESDLKNSIISFLTSDAQKYLVIETGYTKLLAIRTMQALKQIRDEKLNQKPLEKYLNLKNQTYFYWNEFQDIVGPAGDLPRLTSMLVCEFSGPVKTKKIDAELLEKVINNLKVADSKIIFITSQEGILDEYLKGVNTTVFFKTDELSANKLASTNDGGKCTALMEELSPSKFASMSYVDKCAALVENATLGDTDSVAELLKNGVNVNVINGPNESTALHCAAEGGHKDTVLVLLENGAKILPGKSTATPLHLAAGNGHNDVVLVLLNECIDVNLIDRSGKTALHYAAAKHYKNVVRTLLDNGAKLVITTSIDTPLHLAARQGYKDIVEVLLKHKVDAAIKSCGGWTALHHAVFRKHTDVVEILLKHGVNCNVATDYGLAPLHMASVENNVVLVNMLLKYGANINVKYSMGNTPLHYAELHDSLEETQLFIDKWAVVDVRNRKGKMALELALERSFDSLASLLNTFISTCPLPNRP